MAAKMGKSLSQFRIEREIYEIIQSGHDMKNDTCIDISIVDNNIQHLKGIISGPKNTMYEGGTFTVDLILTNYPFDAPIAKFDTEIWHPSIDYETGDLENFMDSLGWTPAFSLQGLLMSLQVFLRTGEEIENQSAIQIGSKNEDIKNEDERIDETQPSSEEQP